jgi:hypothetical protein
MARRIQTYAIRLVEGGGQVKAEVVSVGQSGEQSLKRIETAGERASRLRPAANAADQPAGRPDRGGVSQVRGASDSPIPDRFVRAGSRE